MSYEKLGLKSSRKEEKDIFFKRIEKESRQTN